MLWRQGDVFIESTPLIPAGAVQQAHLVLVEGELTGHSHRIADPDTALLYRRGGDLFLQVIAERANVVHQEHGTVTLLRGRYRVWRQREFDPTVRRGDRRLDPFSQSRWVID